jgi:glycerate kinase
VLAPDKFKGSLRADEVVQHLLTGLRRVAPGVAVRSCPVADGGEGTLDAAVSAGYERVPVTVEGPTGAPVRSGYARRGDTAVVEMADASGLSRLPGGRPAPLAASSFGTGQLVGAAVDAGCRTVMIGIGGSAGTDGGAGLVEALGARLTDDRGRPVARGGGALSAVRHLDVTGLRARLGGTRVIVACDVDNPLLGPSGAAAVFGPQKGAAPAEVRTLEQALRRWAEVVTGAAGPGGAGRPGAGAAGGVGFAALVLLAATPVRGVDMVLDLLRFRELLSGARLVVTGEGMLDEQTMAGKAPFGVAAASRAAGVPVVAVCGRRAVAADRLAAAGFAATYALTDLEPDPRRCIADAGPLLEWVAQQCAAEWLAGQ